MLQIIRRLHPSCLLPSFSTKKSQQQLAYYQHRQQCLPNFKYNQIKPTISIDTFHSKYKQISKDKQGGEEQVISGRVSSIRTHGKTTFIDVREEHVKLQIAVGSKMGQQVLFRRGDVVGVKGVAFVTKKGELSMLVNDQKDIWIVSPCLWMLPEYNTLKDNQLRYRNKHLDLLTNPQSLNMIKTRSRMVSALRDQLQNRGYLEVETPVLSPSCGGAIAKPFTTYHNDHKMDLFMRIAPQLFLKRLLVGGISRVFEIGKNFRNQSIDQTHNPQFTSCELYCAYADYRDHIQLTKELLCAMVRKARGSSDCLIEANGKSIDLAGQWLQVDFIEGLEKATGEKFPQEFQSRESMKFIDHLCVKHHVHCQEPRSAERMLDKLAGHFLQSASYEKPLLILHHPRVLSPLAKPLEDRPHLTARFELFVKGWQLVNAYTELNDPRIQRKNTPGQVDFIEALQYGLMPCAGWGLGVDRLAMLVGSSQRIQEVIIFPLLKDRQT